MTLDAITNALWAALECADNCCTDREMDIIDTGGNYISFDMRQVAQHLAITLNLPLEPA